MTNLDLIKLKIETLCKEGNPVHLSGSITSPKMTFDNAEVKITGAYKNIFQIEETLTGNKKGHTFQYADLAVNHISIKEING